MQTVVILLELVIIPVIAIAVGIAMFRRRPKDDGGRK
jgi:hypothetical protein